MVRGRKPFRMDICRRKSLSRDTCSLLTAVGKGQNRQLKAASVNDLTFGQKKATGFLPASFALINATALFIDFPIRVDSFGNNE